MQKSLALKKWACILMCPIKKELKINFQVLVPTDHKYYKQMKHIYQMIEDGNIKPQTYERFFFNLLLDSPRCEHCLAPLDNSN